MDTVQEQQQFIEKLVKLNNKFIGNEDLLEDFCSEAYKRSYTLFDTLEIKNLEGYLAKVVNTSILTVLRTSGRIRRRSDSYVSTNEVLLDPTPKLVETPLPVVREETISAPFMLYDIADPKDSFEEKIVRKDLLQKIVDIVLVAHKNNPEQEFLKIFYMRYVQEMKQKEIAQEINISQSEVSKRLLEIVETVKQHFNS